MNGTNFGEQTILTTHTSVPLPITWVLFSEKVRKLLTTHGR
jgi:hypothetical protein